MNDSYSKVPSLHHYYGLHKRYEIAEFFRSEDDSWLNFSHESLTQRFVVSGMEKRFDFKESVSAKCFIKCITSKIRATLEQRRSASLILTEKSVRKISL